MSLPEQNYFLRFAMRYPVDASTPKKEFYKTNILAVILDHNPILFVVK